MKTMAMGLLALLCTCIMGCATARDTRLFVNSDISRYIDVTNVSCTRAPNGFCVVRADVLNRTKKDISLEWKVQWLDENGMDLDTATSTWQKQAIVAQDFHALRAVAARKEAVTMRIYIRRLK